METETRVVGLRPGRSVSEKGKNRVSTPNGSNNPDNGMVAGSQCGMSPIVRQLRGCLE